MFRVSSDGACVRHRRVATAGDSAQIEKRTGLRERDLSEDSGHILGDNS